MPADSALKSRPSSKKARLARFEPIAGEQTAADSWEGPAWKEPWWRPAPGEWPVLGWIIVIHVTALVGLVLAPLPGWGVFFLSVALYWVGGIGTTVCYHRSITHRALKLHPVVRQTLTFFAMFNGSGSPTTWAANHRLHHSAADTEDDISSPKIGGFWWAHLRWLWQARQASEERFCRDLGARSYTHWKRVQVLVLAMAYFGGLLISWEAFFWIGSIRLVVALHGQCFVNSVCHLHPHPKEGEDTSRNLFWLGLLHLFQGENWHRNHHKNANCARLGLKTWEIDAGWWVILALEKLRLATDVKRPRIT